MGKTIISLFVGILFLVLGWFMIDPNSSIDSKIMDLRFFRMDAIKTKATVDTVNFIRTDPTDSKKQNSGQYKISYIDTNTNSIHTVTITLPAKPGSASIDIWYHREKPESYSTTDPGEEIESLEKSKYPKWLSYLGYALVFISGGLLTDAVKKIFGKHGAPSKQTDTLGN